MNVYKFGGASVKNAVAIKNLSRILLTSKQDIVVVISAMGKTTNAFEELVTAYFNNNTSEIEKVKNRIYNFHIDIISELDSSPSSTLKRILGNWFSEISAKLAHPTSLNYNFEYDQIVSFGELLSTSLVAEYLSMQSIECEWVDVRTCLKTDSKYREAGIDYELSEKLCQQRFNFNGSRFYITQGFIGSDCNNLTTTLGREGSDYTAAILSYLLNATDLTIWKDVPGLLNADPKWFDDTYKIETMSYNDAIELAYYGMSVIHPKTIQPLQHKDIPLYVRSFIHYTEPGTKISNVLYDKTDPCFIFKVDQVLINISSRDLSFIAEEHLQHVFELFASIGLKINLMQNTAVSFKACVDNDSTRLPHIVEKLNEYFEVKLDNQLELITIRYYNQSTIDRVLVQKEVVLEQRGSVTIQMVVKKF